MNEYTTQLRSARLAALSAGNLLRESFNAPRVIDEVLAHDVKLRLDKECQQLICNILQKRHPNYAVLGEEGGSGGEIEWIVDPLDGTVNYYYGIPLFCVSIALRVHGVLQLGCVYAPMTGELYSAVRGGPSLLNGREIHVSTRDHMNQAIVFIGHGSHDGSGESGIRRFMHISSQVCKMRILGSAALSLCYVAAGKLDAYVEQSIHLWDFAAAQVILEAAGGTLEFSEHQDDSLSGSVTAWNGKLPLHEALQLPSTAAQS